MCPACGAASRPARTACDRQRSGTSASTASGLATGECARPPAASAARSPRNARVTQALIVINVLLYIVELAHSQLGYDWAMLGAGRRANGSPCRGRVRPVVPPDHLAFLPPPGLATLASWTSHSTCGRCSSSARHLNAYSGLSVILAVYLISALGGSILLSTSWCRSSLPQAPQARSSGCSAPGSCSPGGCRPRLRPVVFLIVLNLGISFTVRADCLAGARRRADCGWLADRGLCLCAPE